MYVHCVIITLVLMQSVSCMGTYIPAEVCTSYVQPGDIYLGGIFSLHGGADGEYSKEDCEGLYPVSALQLTEAMAFAVMTINQDDSVLPNVTLGFIIHDDCSWPEYSTWGSLSLVLGAQPSLEGDSCIIPGPTIGGDIKRVIGIVGTGETYTTEVAINTAQLFQRPLVSYGATDQELHGEHGHPYFFGTIPSDSYKASAIIDILLYFEWEYIAMIFSDDHEIHHLEEDIVNLLEVFGICLYAEAELSEDPTEDELQQMVAMLQTHPHAKLAVVLVSSASAFSAVMSSVQSAYPPLERTWLSSDTWEKELIGNAEALGGLFIQFRKPEIMEFEEYFRSLLEGNETNNINPWFYEFCGGSDICHEASQEGFSKELPTLAPTIDAVLALAYALDDTILALSCNGSITDCLLRDKNIQRSILENLRTVEFFGTRGEFYFEHDFVPAQVIVKNLQRSNEGNLELVEVGTWSSTKPYWEQLEINSSLLQWAGGTGDVPISVCRDECNPGYIEVIDSTKRCCWKCQACRVDDIVVGTECVSCEQNEWPNINFTMCEKLIGRTVTWHDPAVVFLSFMTSLGLLLSIVTSCGMIRYRNHALIKASSRELSAVNIFGLILAFVSVFPLLLPPTAGICGVAQSMYALSFTLMYAPLLLKVNRIYRIFESSSKTVKRPRYTGPTAQLVIVAVLVSIQPVLMFITALSIPGTWSTVRELFPSPSSNIYRRSVEVVCNLGFGFVVSMGYNFLLLLACCFFAYKARKVPGNFNEARFYVASVYTTLLFILAALPMYLTGGTAIIVVTSVSLVLLVNGYVTLGCVYIPKIYAIIFKKVGEQDGNTMMQNRERPSSIFQSREGRSFGFSGEDNKVHPSGS